MGDTANELGRLDDSCLPQVASETRVLRDLLERQSLQYRRTVRPVTLEPDEPSLIRAFWDTIGWAPMFENGRIENPEVAAGTAKVRARLAEFAAHERFTLTEADLPARYRLVFAPTPGAGFAVTDERDQTADPAVLRVGRDDNEITGYAPSYLGLCADAVLSAAFDSWYRLRLYLPDGPDSLVGTQAGTAGSSQVDRPFPLLVPTARRLNAALWVTWDRTTTQCVLAAANFEDMVAWLYERDLNGLTILPPLPGDTVRTTGPLTFPASARIRMRSGSWQGRSALRYRVGWIADIAVVIEERGDGLRISVDPRHRTALENLRTSDQGRTRRV